MHKRILGLLIPACAVISLTSCKNNVQVFNMNDAVCVNYLAAKTSKAQFNEIYHNISSRTGVAHDVSVPYTASCSPDDSNEYYFHIADNNRYENEHIITNVTPEFSYDNLVPGRTYYWKIYGNQTDNILYFKLGQISDISNLTNDNLSFNIDLNYPTEGLGTIECKISKNDGIVNCISTVSDFNKIKGKNIEVNLTEIKDETNKINYSFGSGTSTEKIDKIYKIYNINLNDFNLQNISDGDSLIYFRLGNIAEEIKEASLPNFTINLISPKEADGGLDYTNCSIEIITKRVFCNFYPKNISNIIGKELKFDASIFIIEEKSIKYNITNGINKMIKKNPSIYNINVNIKDILYDEKTTTLSFTLGELEKTLNDYKALPNFDIGISSFS